MNGTIVAYRQNRHSQKGNHMIVKIASVDERAKAEALVGKAVTFNTGKKDIKGTVAGAHGNSGAIRVIFETGMPGQALSQKVKIE